MLDRPHDRTDIHELAIDTPLPAHAELRRRYETLQQSPLYNASRKEWFDSIDANGSVRTFTRPHAQLVGALVEQLLGMGPAKERLADLRKLKYFAGSGWAAGDVTEPNRYDTRDQLLDIYIQALDDPPHAQTLLFDMRQSHYYDRNTGQWRGWMKPLAGGNVSRGPSSYLEEQLWYVLAELASGDVNGNGASMWHHVEQRFHDREHDEWREAYDPLSYAPPANKRGAADQLLAVFVESYLDPRKARLHLQRLKASEFYDHGRGYWISLINEQDIPSPEVHVSDQLLALMIEIRLEDLLGEEKEEARYEIPKYLDIN